MNIQDAPVSLTARWFVVQTGLRQEKLALENLHRQKFEAYCPFVLKELRPRGQPARIVPLPFFPRYVFVRVDMTVCGWRSIYGTRGVSGVLMSTDRGSKALGRMVEEIQAREVKGLLQLAPEATACPYQEGQAVTFKDMLEAIFVERVDDKRCRIMISLIGGRDSEHVVDLADIESR